MRSYLISSVFMFIAVAAYSAEEQALEQVSTDVQPEIAPVAKPATWLGVVDDENSQGSMRVNVRSGEGVNYHILTVLERGAKVRVLGQSGEWLKIELVETALPVWLSREFGTSINDTTIEINADRVVLRGAATTKSSSLGIVDKGLKLKVIESHPQWLRVEAPAGVTGYINAQFVKLAASAESVVAPQPETVVPEVAPAIEDSKTATLTPSTTPDTLTDVMKIRKAYEEKIAEVRNLRAEELTQLQRMGLAGGYLAAGLLVNEEQADLKVTHRIDLGDRTLYYLKSKRDAENNILIDLDKYSGRKVGIKGKVVKNAGPVRIVEVAEVCLLDVE